MAARNSAPPRDLDYTNIGKVGRRTGITLPPRQRDEHGLEEMTGLFSSPHKPYEIQKRLVQSVENGDIVTPRPVRASTQTPDTIASIRRSVRGSARAVPRSASPRKSGISGSARRSAAVRISALELDAEPLSAQEESADEAEAEAQAEVAARVETREKSTRESRDDRRRTATPVRSANVQASSARPATRRKFSPETTPLRTRILKSKSAYVPRVSDAQLLSDGVADKEATGATPTRNGNTPSIHIQPEETHDNPQHGDDDDGGPPPDDDTENLPIDLEADSDREYSEPPLPPNIDDDDEEEDESFAPATQAERRSQTKANSRRKRKSDAVEESARMDSSPAAKRAKRVSDDHALQQAKRSVGRPRKDGTPSQPLAKKDKNTKLSKSRQQEVDDVVEKIRARPGPKKSLYVLRRETDGNRTRSGRIVIRPVAYWRNEGVQYDAGDGSGAGIGDGHRFPLLSIKEIIRREEVPEVTRPRNRGRKSKRKGKAKQTDDDSETDAVEDGNTEDPDADDWELDPGTLRAPMGVWDPELQACADEEEEQEIAYAAAAISTKQVPGQTFQYAKLVSTNFFGTGIVELPAGGLKKVKNSRKMHMSFFVYQGRVSVEIGPVQGPNTRFSVGKGGFWQVPRGNNYSIENEHGKTARLFFSQACEPVPDAIE